MNEKVLVTGAAGMIGSKVVELLPEYGYEPIPITRQTCNLLDGDEVIRLFCEAKPHYVINCAGWNGGISFNHLCPADIYWQNTTLALNVLRASFFCEAKKVVSTITSCAYPEHYSNIALEEYDLHAGSPSDSVACHGFARRTLDIYGKQLFKQHGFMAVSLIFNNCYGPNDRFDPNRSKFLAALIKKFCDAKREEKESVTLWGTGKARREVLYRDDAAIALIVAMKGYDDPTAPLNVGSGKDYKIKKYARMVAKAAGYNGEIFWDTEKPNGQMKKLLNVDRMYQHMTLPTFMDLKDGISRTVKWYNNNYDKLTK